jgi:hypothetical protein
VLRFDSTGKADQISALLEKARNELISAEEHQLLAEALRNHQPWLEWTGKREAEEKGWFEVDPVALNIHERISTLEIGNDADPRVGTVGGPFLERISELRDRCSLGGHDIFLDGCSREKYTRNESERGCFHGE